MAVGMLETVLSKEGTTRPLARAARRLPGDGGNREERAKLEYPDLSGGWSTPPSGREQNHVEGWLTETGGPARGDG